MPFSRGAAEGTEGKNTVRALTWHARTPPALEMGPGTGLESPSGFGLRRRSFLSGVLGGGGGSLVCPRPFLGLSVQTWVQCPLPLALAWLGPAGVSGALLGPACRLDGAQEEGPGEVCLSPTCSACLFQSCAGPARGVLPQFPHSV